VYQFQYNPFCAQRHSIINDIKSLKVNDKTVWVRLNKKDCNFQVYSRSRVFKIRKTDDAESYIPFLLYMESIALFSRK